MGRETSWLVFGSSFDSCLPWRFFFCGCSASNSVGVPGGAGPGGAATADVAGLKIEAYPTGSDGGSVSVVSESGNASEITISGLRLIIERREDGALDVQIDGKDYGIAKESDHLLIDRNRQVFLNDQPLAAVGGHE